MFMYFNFYKTKVRSHSWPKAKTQLDRGSIRSSPRYGLSTPFRLTKEQCWTVSPCSWLNRRPALGPSCTEFSTLDAGILIMVQQVRLIMLSLNMLDYSMSLHLLSTLIFFGRTSIGVTILSKFYSLGFVMGPLMLKSYRAGWCEVGWCGVCWCCGP